MSNDLWSRVGGFRHSDDGMAERVRSRLRAGEVAPRIAIVGAGAGGIAMAIQLQDAGFTELTIFEKSVGFGGTWRDNTYPGCACDAPSHLYSFSFAPNPDWTRKYATQPEILAYMESVAHSYGLDRVARFGVEVAQIRRDETRADWELTLGDGTVERFDVVIAAMGQLNRPAWPNLPGLDSFDGTVFHSARWDHDHDLRGERVAVIGNGASAVQFVPEVVGDAAHTTLFQRSANWIAPKPDREYPAWERWAFRWVPGFRRLYRASIYLRYEARFMMFHRDSRLGRLFVKAGTKQLEAEVVGKGLTTEMVVPDYPPGCKRILISNDYYPALRRDDVTVTTSPIDRIEPGAIVTADGARHDVDTIILGTGFEATEFLAPIRVIGEDGVELGERWKDGASAYLGIAIPDFPNLFVLYGPNTNLGHNSIIFMLECQVGYILALLRAMVDGHHDRVEVRADAMAAYERDLETHLAQTVWAEGCDSWYKTATGRITNNWPRTTIHYWHRTRQPDPHAFELDAPAAVGSKPGPAAPVPTS